MYSKYNVRITKPKGICTDDSQKRTLILNVQDIFLLHYNVFRK